MIFFGLEYFLFYVIGKDYCLRRDLQNGTFAVKILKTIIMIENVYRRYKNIAKCCGLNLLLLLFVNYESTAQNAKNIDFYKVISFGEKIDFGNIDPNTTWTLTNSNKNIYSTLYGNEINNYSFQEPGEYDVTFHESKKHDGECDHASFPDRFRIKVEPVRISFDFSKITFSEKIVRGRNYSDLIITVPAKITTKENSNLKLPAPAMSVAGIGVSMTSETLDKEISLGNKTQLLKYKLSGSVNKETYLMFDFYDFNNQVQTYNLPQIIK